MSRSIDKSVQIDDEGWLPGPMGTMAGRLALDVDELGPEEATRLSDKSWKQLLRYCSGAEPPFGVLRAFVAATGATFDWLAFGVVTSETDRKLTRRGLNGELVRLEAILKSDLSAQERSDMSDLLLVTRSRIRDIEKASSDVRKDSGQQVPVPPVDLSRLEQAIKAVERGLDERQVAVTPDIKAELTIVAYEMFGTDAEPGADAAFRRVLRLVKG